MGGYPSGQETQGNQNSWHFKRWRIQCPAGCYQGSELQDIFFTIYSMGLRLGEGVNLKVGDIDTNNMRVIIRSAKGNKDRLVPLPDATLQVLRRFWLIYRHEQYIFPSRKHGSKYAHRAKKPIKIVTNRILLKLTLICNDECYDFALTQYALKLIIMHKPKQGE